MSRAAPGMTGTNPSPTESPVVLGMRWPSGPWFTDVTTSMSGNGGFLCLVTCCRSQVTEDSFVW
jgi:hypothetical protein